MVYRPTYDMPQETNNSDTVSTAQTTENHDQTEAKTTITGDQSTFTFGGQDGTENSTNAQASFGDYEKETSQETNPPTAKSGHYPYQVNNPRLSRRPKATKRATQKAQKNEKLCLSAPRQPSLLSFCPVVSSPPLLSPATALLSLVPFAMLLVVPVDLLLYASAPNIFPLAPHEEIAACLAKAGKITILAMQMTWVLGNLADCTPVEIFSASLRTPAPITALTPLNAPDAAVAAHDTDDEPGS